MSLKLFLAFVNGGVKARPLVSAIGVAGVKNGLCDIAVQKFEGRDINWRRTATFAAFGVGWVGGGQYTLFNKVYPRLFPGLLLERRTLSSVAAATVVDNFVHIPFVYLPLFYATREMAFSSPTPFESARRNWQTNFWEDITYQAGLFVPAQTVNFFFNPPYLRVPFIVATGLLWVAILSHLRGEHEDPSCPPKKAKDDDAGL